MDQALSPSEFNQQVETLLTTHGAASFAAVTGTYPRHTLFIAGDRVIAESADSPRHRYGTFCELDSTLNDEALTAYVWEWLNSGDAHEQYLGMNVCRYNCQSETIIPFTD